MLHTKACHYNGRSVHVFVTADTFRAATAYRTCYVGFGLSLTLNDWLSVRVTPNRRAGQYRSTILNPMHNLSPCPYFHQRMETMMNTYYINTRLK